MVRLFKQRQTLRKVFVAFDDLTFDVLQVGTHKYTVEEGYQKIKLV